MEGLNLHPVNMAKPTLKPWFLREWRKHRHMTQQQLADAAGFSKPFISLLESGGRQYTQETLETLATALGTDTASLIGRHPSDRPARVISLFERLGMKQQEKATDILEAFLKDDEQESSGR